MLGFRLELFAVLALALAPIAGVMAFLITYEEYSHHGLPRSRVMRISLETAVVASVAIAIIMIAAAGFLGFFGQ